MTASLIESSSRVTARLVDLLWDQWSSLGLAGYVHAEPSHLVDPEALLLLSTRVARHDARLFDEILDWLRENGSRINLQRLRHIMKEYSFGEPAVLGAMAECLAIESRLAKWKLLLRHIPAPAKSDPEPLFFTHRFFGEPHPIFLKWGLQRGKLEFRRMSQPPPTDQAAGFLFKLRALFGNQARAEVMAWLLANEYGHPAEIARQIGYFRRTVQLVLNELAESGQIRAIRVGREKNFALRHEDWRFLLDDPVAKEFPRWINWPSLFHSLLLFQEALAKPGLDEKSERFQAIQLREALDQAMPALVRAGVAHRLNTTRDLRGADLVRSLLADLDTLLDR